MFFRRIFNQICQLQNFLLIIFGFLKGSSIRSLNEPMVQDEFGLHKLIVVATKCGKIYGLDNLSGKIVWQIKVENAEPFSAETSSPIMPMYLIRNTRHYPLPSECVVLVKYKPTGETGLVRFNPITGSVVGSSPIMLLGIRVKQSLLLHQMDSNFYKGIVLLDENNRVFVYPESSKSVVLSNPSSIFIFTANTDSGILEGFTLATTENNTIISSMIWRVNLGNNIIALVGKNHNEKVHSQGRVLGDRSVLYKYVNPNLITVVTRAYHPSHKSKRFSFYFL